ncbi:polysaccharide biosynthesis/export protein PslE [Pseudomonas sp. FH4]|uniref:GumC family protein n=1 Tax=Pseudomonas fluorescens group TaxID=136843 RepID=UPI0003DCC7AF|nr:MULTISPECIES: exopolysaccharide transport family protein [Pseudomonas fluorescens group]ETK19746.1 polysaccharide biosynthesis/export protein PslE [Pseudomonas sp. FH4]MBF8008480.1 lipopolysaccharide biosynthesis protein [Pseudomonas brenneri]WJM89467.1 exopolysaccharide transport family protein [Pseudomonas brenneri]
MIEIRSLRDLLRLFFIFRREFKLAVITTIVVAVLGAFLLPARYESDARLLVKPGRDNTTLPIEAANRQTLIAPSTQHDPIVDEEKMLTGRPIVHIVAERYLAMTSEPPQGFWKVTKFYVKKAAGEVLDAVRSVLQLIGLAEKQSPLERLATKLEKNFEAGHEPGSSVIEISFTWDDPVIAQKVVETWVDAYLEERARILGRKSLHTFYEAERTKVATNIQGLKDELQGRLKQIDSISVDARLKNLTNQIDRVTDAKVTAQNQIAGIRSFLANASQQIKNQPAEVVTGRETSLNPTQLDLKRQLNALQVERARLLRTYLPGTPQVNQIEQNIRDMQDLSAQEATRLERSQNTAPNSLVINVKQQIIDAQLQERKLAGEIENYDKTLAELRAQRDQAMTDEPELNKLTQQLRTAEKSYALYSENLEQARIDHELDSSQISNIALIEHATLNPARVFPKSLLILLFTIPAGLAVGLLTIYVLYLLDQRIHDGARLQEVFGIPLWSSIPDVQHATPAALTASIYRLYSLLPAERIASEGFALGLTSARHGEGVSFIIEQLKRLLEERGHRVSVNGSEAAKPGEVLLLDASALSSNPQAFLTLRRADQIVLVIEARTSTVPTIENALSLLTTAFGKVDGMILNRRRFEVPANVLARINSWRGAA